MGLFAIAYADSELIHKLEMNFQSSNVDTKPEQTFEMWSPNVAALIAQTSLDYMQQPAECFSLQDDLPINQVPDQFGIFCSLPSTVSLSSESEWDSSNFVCDDFGSSSTIPSSAHHSQTVDSSHPNQCLCPVPLMSSTLTSGWYIVDQQVQHALTSETSPQVALNFPQDSLQIDFGIEETNQVFSPADNTAMHFVDTNSERFVKETFAVSCSQGIEVFGYEPMFDNKIQVPSPVSAEPARQVIGACKKASDLNSINQYLEMIPHELLDDLSASDSLPLNSSTEFEQSNTSVNFDWNGLDLIGLKRSFIIPKVFFERNSSCDSSQSATDSLHMKLKSHSDFISTNSIECVRWKKFLKNPNLAVDDLERRRNVANKQERKRMFRLNQALEKLRRVIPNDFVLQYESKSLSVAKKLSKIKTLRMAIEYIAHLSCLLNQ